MSKPTDIVGFLGGATIAISLLPQVIKTWRTRSASDISYFYQFIYITGCTMTNIYSLSEGLWPVFVPCLFEQTFILTLTLMKLVYDRLDNGKTTVVKGDLKTTSARKERDLEMGEKSDEPESSVEEETSIFTSTLTLQCGQF